MNLLSVCVYSVTASAGEFTALESSPGECLLCVRACMCVCEREWYSDTGSLGSVSYGLVCACLTAGSLGKYDSKRFAFVCLCVCLRV